MKREELLELIPAYALDALDPDERLEVEQLLVHDAEAQALLRDYEDIASILPLAAPQRPAPSHLRADLKTRLANHQSATSNTPETKTAIPDESGNSRKPIIPFPKTIMATAAAILVVVIGLVFVLLNNTKPVNPNEVRFNEFLEQSGTSIALVPNAADSVNGELVFASDGSQGVLRIESLPNRSEEESYQLWAITEDEGLQSIGLFYWPTGHGPYYVPIDKTFDNLQVVAMTIEPFDGSPLGDAPTGDHLFDVFVQPQEG